MLFTKKKTILFFVSIIGIIITSFMLISTYAYQSMQIKYEKGSNSDLTIEVGNLEVNYTANNKIELSNMPFLPDYKTADYLEFKIDNTKSTDIVAYTISLKNLEYSSSLVNNAFKYNLMVLNENGTLDLLSEGDFSSLSGTSFDIPLINEYFNYINKGEIETLRLYLWLKDDLVTESLKNASFKGTLEITSLFTSDVTPIKLSEIVLSDDRVTKNGILSSFINQQPGELGVFEAEDDYGTTYYYRGAQSYNYVEFAGLPWRIMRRNGDGSVRLILANSIAKVTKDGTALGKDIYFGSGNDNAHIGYMYGLTGMTETDNVDKCLFVENSSIVDKITEYSTKELCEENNGKWTTNAYEATHVNFISSNMKNVLDNLYKTHLLEYDSYIADSIFCGDKTLWENTDLGYGTNYTRYNGNRKHYTNNYTFMCAHNQDGTISNENSGIYSRYTVNKQTTEKGIITNGDLRYPIGIPSLDEIKFAGAFSTSKYNYLVNIDLTDSFHTMTPSEASININTGVTYPSMWYAIASINPTTKKPYEVWKNYIANSPKPVRPVINIKEDVNIKYGIGTKENPYVIS